MDSFVFTFYHSFVLFSFCALRPKQGHNLLSNANLMVLPYCQLLKHKEASKEIYVLHKTNAQRSLKLLGPQNSTGQDSLSTSFALQIIGCAIRCTISETQCYLLKVKQVISFVTQYQNQSMIARILPHLTFHNCF